MNIDNQIVYAPGEIVTEKLVGNHSGVVIVLALDKGTEIPTHTAHADVMAMCLEGEIEFVIDGHARLLHTHDYVVMKPDTEHSLRALQRSKLMVVKENA